MPTIATLGFQLYSVVGLLSPPSHKLQHARGKSPRDPPCMTPCGVTESIWVAGEHYRTRPQLSRLRRGAGHSTHTNALSSFLEVSISNIRILSSRLFLSAHPAAGAASVPGVCQNPESRQNIMAPRQRGKHHGGTTQYATSGHGQPVVAHRPAMQTMTRKIGNLKRDKRPETTLHPSSTHV